MSLIRQAAKGLFAAADLALPSPAGPRILIYHQVGAGLGRQMEVTVSNFQRQLDWLAANCHVVSLEAALGSWEDRDSNRLVVLTFDDGYRDTYTTAFPILKERDIPFTLYLATESIETGIALGPSPHAEPLTWSQIEEMLNSGLVTVGSHTHRHVDLRQLSSEQVEEELSVCDRLIESRIGLSPSHFAYPWGYWAKASDEVVRRRYRTAMLGAPQWSDRDHDPHMIHRFPVQLSDGFRWFRARLRGGLLLEESIRRRLRRYQGT